jgi:hypothetical protein
MSSRTWHKGPPPHIGWWNASNGKVNIFWRWWNGKHWSEPCFSGDCANTAARYAKIKHQGWPEEIEWTNYYPKNARVPRINPGENK